MPAAPKQASVPAAKRQRPNPPSPSSDSPAKQDGPAASQGVPALVPIGQPAPAPAAPQGVPPLQSQLPNMSKVADHQDPRKEFEGSEYRLVTRKSELNATLYLKDLEIPARSCLLSNRVNEILLVA